MPPICVLCAGRADSDGLCRGCREELPWQATVQDESLSLFDYAPPIDHMIRRLKFSGDLVFARVLGGLMASGIASRDVQRPDAIVPMPMHRGRLASRGFNQALELARPVATRLDVPIDYASCVRVRATAEQSTLDVAGRRANVRGAFAARRRLPGRIAIVDDVITTGHTIEALVDELTRAGARQISLWICARATLSLTRDGQASDSHNPSIIEARLW